MRMVVASRLGICAKLKAFSTFSAESAPLKTYNIELQRVKSQSFAHGLIKLHIDALVSPALTPEDKMPTSSLSFTEENGARADVAAENPARRARRPQSQEPA